MKDNTEIWIFLIIQVVGFLTLFLKGFHDRRVAKAEAEAAAANRKLELEAIRDGREQDRLDREEDRLDREQLALLTLDQLEQVQVAGNERLKKFVKETTDLKKATMAGIRYSKEAVQTANNTNHKIALLGKAIVDEQSEIRQVEIVNTPEHPVPVEDRQEKK